MGYAIYSAGTIRNIYRNSLNNEGVPWLARPLYIEQCNEWYKANPGLSQVWEFVLPESRCDLAT